MPVIALAHPLLLIPSAEVLGAYPRFASGRAIEIKIAAIPINIPNINVFCRLSYETINPIKFNNILKITITSAIHPLFYNLTNIILMKLNAIINRKLKL